ncbi:hypothetical protein LCGC14_1042880 [marine sediment metagenome]|uniref:Uncharacterized protein n=1 Tax=marine sediment metagenome TaxID=412755 RepID=A0A0F9MR71_9ZZZZ
MITIYADALIAAIGGAFAMGLLAGVLACKWADWGRLKHLRGVGDCLRKDRDVMRARLHATANRADREGQRRKECEAVIADFQSAVREFEEKYDYP